MRLDGLSATSVYLSLVARRAVLTHFHLIFFLPKYEGDDFAFCTECEYRFSRIVLSEWQRNYGSDKKPDYRPCCTYVEKFVRGKLRRNYDFHYVNPRLSDGGTADVGFYVLKYMLKPSSRAVRLQQALRLNLPEDEYEDIWKLVRPRSFCSKHFGLAGSGIKKDWKPSQKVLDYLKSNIVKSKSSSGFPCFINPVDGKTFPLSRYYKSRGDVYSIGDALDFFYNDKKARPDNVVIRDDYDPLQLSSKAESFAAKVNDIDLKQDSFDLDDLYL